MKGIKGFHKGLICSGMGGEKQYVENTVFEEDVKPVACSRGMHFCENPLEVFNYYKPGESEYAEVEALGDTVTHDDDSKVATNKLRVGFKIDLKGVINAGVAFIFEKTKASPDTTATTGNCANAATTGESANAATTGNCANAATTGESANAATTGNYANAATTGENSIAAAIGVNSKVKGAKDNWIVAAEWKFDETKCNYKPVCVKTTQVDGENIKADTWYKLENGEFVEVSAD